MTKIFSVRENFSFFHSYALCGVDFSGSFCCLDFTWNHFWRMSKLNFSLQKVQKFLNFKLRASQCGKTRNSLSLKKKSSNQLFSDFFSKTIVFTKFLRKMCEREFLQFPHCASRSKISVKSTSLVQSLIWRKNINFSFFHSYSSQCGNCRNSLSHFFRKNFVKAMVLLKKLLNSWFDDFFFQWERISRFFTLCSLHPHDFLQKFCQINFFYWTFML